MRHFSALRLIGGVMTVLAIAVVAFVLRGAAPAERAVVAESIPGFKSAAPEDPLDFSVGAASADAAPKDASAIATARKRSILVRAAPGGKAVKRIRQRTFNGQRIPLTFLVREQRKGWVKVDLPTRPNQSRGWVSRAAVDVTFTKLRIEVRSRSHRLRLLDGDRVVARARIGVGKALSPTPPGRYFVTDIVRAKDPKGFYGPYALGLSAHSTVYTSFAGGNGQVGIHGTNQPAALGSDVSAGCIRVRNSVIQRLAKRVPLGTPVTIIS